MFFLFHDNKVSILFTGLFLFLSLNNCGTSINNSSIYYTSTQRVEDISSATSSRKEIHTTETQEITHAITNPPTLSTDNAIRQLKNQLIDNGKCMLPCVWEITPGRDDYAFAKNILYIFSEIS